jgi:hypothetical protein
MAVGPARPGPEVGPKGPRVRDLVHKDMCPKYPGLDWASRGII